MTETPHSETTRLETFSDGVIAIIITIMVLEFRIPESATLEALRPLLPVFLSYVLSFINLGIYWNNHHHLLHATDSIGGGVMWANMHLLFWLSLIPFTTEWVGESHGEYIPAVLYSAVLFLAACAYTILVKCILRNEGPDSALSKALGRDVKGKISIAAYVAAIGAAFVNPLISYALIALLSIMWVIPDSRLQPFFDHEQRG